MLLLFFKLAAPNKLVTEYVTFACIYTNRNIMQKFLLELTPGTCIFLFLFDMLYKEQTDRQQLLIAETSASF